MASGDIDVLLADYAAQRDDERTYHTILGALFAIAVPLVLGSSSVVLRSCGSTFVSFQSTSNGIGKGNGGGKSAGVGASTGATSHLHTHASGSLTSSGVCSDLPHWAFSFIPSLPLAMLAFVTYLIYLASLRSSYLRALETEIRERTRIELQLGATKIRTPAFSSLTDRLVRGNKAPQFARFLWPVIYLSVYAVTTGITVVSMYLTRPPLLRAVCVVVYAVCGIGIARMAYEALFHRQDLGVSPREPQVPRDTTKG